ncbi:hypothetical protein PPMP20_18430 [Paraburkholderia phymatum]|uniref:Uncharacterized protein n=1 Tax=Paraburkholderia phymatum (strain DSM 17167 / CIP 108236 / LMG 21445 / STM815) TaxID=391038 RepID=B2JTZ8_PARP8|nr:hypothetical protein [Paraburkholderia phymatum]ACC76051.1 hypothetical protein Bphy_7046 [Paraburkholderia phymatum STM815]
MSIDELEVQELLHIEAVLTRLENLNIAGCTSEHRFITDPAYWHRRLMDTCAGGSSAQLITKKQELLERLSAISHRLRRMDAQP